MEDEQLNEMIRLALGESRKPPEPPLDAMWANIEHRAFDMAPHRAMPAPWVRWATPALAAAAAMIIGVGLGWSLAPRGSVVTRFVTTPSQSVATNQNVVATPVPDSSTTRNAIRTASAQTLQSARPQSPKVLVANLPEQPTQSGANARLASSFDDVGGSDMSRYLVQTSALLASLPSARSTAASDTAIATRAGELLTQTHLLLDSKAGSDPTLHKLLEDLELVLAQVARLRVQRNGTDLQLIHQALTVRDVLPRVHDATVEASITD